MENRIIVTGSGVNSNRFCAQKLLCAFGPILFLVISILLSGCKDNPTHPIPSSNEGMTLIYMDSVFVLGSDRISNRIVIRVEPPELAEDRTMYCQISGGHVSTHFRLYDDGSLNRVEDNIRFADTSSHDQAADDGLFTRWINSRFTVNSGDYLFTFFLTGVPPPDTIRVTVTVQPNSSPGISSFTLPDSINSGNHGQLFTATVFDEEGFSDVVEVHLNRYNSISLSTSAATYNMSRTNDSTWTWGNTPGIAVGVSTGYSYYTVTAFDFIGLILGDSVESQPDSCWLENLPPHIISVEGPEEVILPEVDSTKFHYIITVSDDQGNYDLDSLLLILSDIDGVLGGFVYFDDGDLSSFDSVAYDGRYTATFSVTPDKTPGRLFTFEWIPTDKSSQHGESFFTTLIFLPSQSTPQPSPFIRHQNNQNGSSHFVNVFN